MAEYADNLRAKALGYKSRAAAVLEIAASMSLEADKAKLMAQAASLEIEAEELLLRARDLEAKELRLKGAGESPR